MKELPDYINNFNNLDEIELVLNILVNKFNRKLVTEIKYYKKDINIKTNALMISKINIFTTDNYSNAMSFKEFKRKFIVNSMTFKSIY